MAFVLYRQGKTAAALKEFETAAQLQPDMAEAFYHIGEIYAATGKKDEARKSYQKAVDLKPDYNDAILGLKKLEE